MSSYTRSPFATRRRATREVRIGDVGVGGENPIRVQSMTTTDTQDVAATADQAERLAAAGCEIVRITAPSIKDAEALGPIHAELARRGVRAPLVADIHFTPNAALTAALHVEKVRINPGNYADKKRFEVREYSDAQYAEELERVAERFRPLVRRCKELGRVMRIGTNHGSLSDRVMNRFGDTPLGMVESALEFLDVCEDEGYRDVVFSMKASNPIVAIHAYRLLAARLAERDPGPGYPLHVGVTEAGDGDDGRVKSAIGIGTLLEDGLGDTIRVSLTEDPVKEIPVARALAGRYDRREQAPIPLEPGVPYTADPYAHARRETAAVGAVGGDANPVRVELDLGPVPGDPAAAADELARALGGLGDVACEGLFLDASHAPELAAAETFREALAKNGIAFDVTLRVPAPLVGAAAAIADRVALRIADGTDLPHEPALPLERSTRSSEVPLEWSLVAPNEALPGLLEGALRSGVRPDLVSVQNARPVHGARLVAALLAGAGLEQTPVALRYRADAFTSLEVAVLEAATDLGAPLCDGIGDLVSVGGLGPPERSVALAYRILQGARLRTSWTEFISCPSCGRTLFDLEETTARIKAKTAHLPGLKIAVMGCIVNGPGEMADADFGYVGSGVARVDLYVGHERVVRNVPADAAPDRLVDLIREHGRWVDP